MKETSAKALSPVESFTYEEFKRYGTSERLRSILERFRHDPLMPDRVFNGIYPTSWREIGAVHWSPVHVARRAVEFLVGSGNGKGLRVLDVGSGIGKVCLIGALLTEAEFVGIERRDYLVNYANSLARDHSIANMRCVRGEMVDMDWGRFDAFYLFNPFYESVFPSALQDRFTILSEEFYQMQIAAVEARLRSLRVGARVVTFFGFGGRFPAGYSMEESERIENGSLDLWIKRS